MCHVILAMPLIGIVVFWILPLPMAAALYALIVVSSSILYYAVVRAMRQPVVTGMEGMIGKTGWVIDSSAGRARIAVGNETWNATSPASLHHGEHVEITGLSGLWLEVVPESAEGETQRKTVQACHSGKR